MSARKKEKIVIFDTTLRDGEQSPGCRMDADSKLLIAQQLSAMGVDVIEAGFPIISQGEQDSVAEIAKSIHSSTICALARTKKEDIEAAARVLEKAKHLPRIHTFVATSDVHMKNKLHRSPDQILEMAAQSVRLARQYVDDVEFSPEDAARSGRDFLATVVREAIAAGATTINIPDTVGYSVAREYYDLIRFLRERIPELNSVVLSAHCHNDLGLAVANTLFAVEAGVRQLECCVLGIGERAGNAQLEAVVMALKTRADHYGVEITLNTRRLGSVARLVASVIGKHIPDTLPVVGGNVFSHASGIHRDGVLKDQRTYEIMNPEEVGWEGDPAPLTKHSGRHALEKRLKDLGYAFDQQLLQDFYSQFCVVADSKTFVYNDDLHWIWQQVSIAAKVRVENLIKIARVDYHRVGDQLSASVVLSLGESEFEASGSGDGPVASVWDAITKALYLQKLMLQKMELKDFHIGKSSGGVEALGLVTLRVESDGNVGYGRGSDTDIVLAFAKALLSAINHLMQAPLRNGT